VSDFQWIGLAFILLGLAWTAGFAFAHFRAAGKAKAAESWPSTLGRVVSCEVRIEESRDRHGGTTTWYNPVVTYSYTAAGRQLQGTRLRFGNPRSGSRKKADAAIAPYAVGSSPAVRYNPERPEECVLETRKPSPVYLIMAVFGLLFVGFGIVFTGLA
jgi:hypothetical protein